MIDALTHNSFAFFAGYYYPTLDNAINDTNAIYFEYEEIADSQHTAGQTMNNLLVDVGRKTIRTTWDIGFRERGYVLLGRSKYMIESVAREEMTGHSQVNFMFTNSATEYTLQLTRVTNARGISR